MDPSARPSPRTAPHPAAPDPGAGGLLVVCALGVERAALRPGARAAGGVRLLRAGMGPDASGAAVARALAGLPAPGPAVLVTGFCAGLAAGVRPGDVVVDDASDAAAVLAAAAARAAAPHGVTVHTGRIACSDHVVRGAERAALAASGAVAVDMESGAVRQAARAAGPRPTAAVRVVVDTPDHELVRPGTLLHGVRAYRVLRSLMPSFVDWHRSPQLPWR
jgi:nucleoside phosphorylase